MRAQDRPAQPPPVFKSGIDLVAVDVTVVDRDGRPVRGLAAGDFSLKVDGTQRRIASVEFISHVLDIEPPPPASLPPSASTYTTNEFTPVGRLILLVVDEGNIRGGEGRQALRSAIKFLDRLTPADRVGFAAIPGPGARVEFTADHDAVRTAMARTVGRAEPFLLDFAIGTSEAVRVQNGDPGAAQELVIRECGVQSSPDCALAVLTEARTYAMHLLREAEASLRELARLVAALGDIEGPKTLVLVSEGMIADTLRSELEQVGRDAQAARVNIYVMRLDTPRFDVTMRRPSPTITNDERLRSEGLEYLAGAARGTLINVPTSAEPAFDRIARELSGYYLIGFEPQAADRNGRLHRIQVEVSKPGTFVRARREFTAPARITDGPDRERLARMLRAPVLSNDLPLRVTSYVYQEPGGSKLRLVVSAELDPKDTGRVSTANVGLVVSDDKGRVVTSAIDRARSSRYVGTVVVEPGRYRLKFAAMDAEGRRGSVERRVDATLISAGPFQLGDLMLAEPGVRRGLPAQPALDRAPGDRVLGYLEIYSSDGTALRDAKVDLEIAEREDGPAIVTTPAELSRPEGKRRTVQGVLPVRLVPPGEYVARAIVSSPSGVVARLARAVRITREKTAVSEAEAGAAATRLRPEVPRFQKEDALQPPVLGAFLDELVNVAPPSARMTAAIEQARGGTFANLPKDAETAPQDGVALAFLRGLDFFARGQLPAAHSQFNLALRLSPDFFPALVYVGACYAARGLDGEAVGAWQTSLSIEPESRNTFLMLADALFRANDGEQAVSVLEEARDNWPDDDAFTRRLATAYTMVGRQAEAVTLLEPYLARHPDDHEALFLAMRLIYERAASGEPLAPEDRARLKRYAAAYTSTKGPQAAIVGIWVRYVDTLRH